MPKIGSSHLSRNLQFLMKENKISLSELAKETGTKPTTLHGYIHGIQPQSLTIIKQIADFFNLSIDQLIFGERNKAQKSPNSSLIAPEGKYQIIIEVKKISEEVS